MEDKYIRVGTTLYKIVQQPLQSGEIKECRKVWGYETLRQDHSKDYISQIEKYDGFCCVPDHINYQRTIGNFLNDYEPIDAIPKEGEFPKITECLQHIFAEQYEYALDYIQLLYTQPRQRLPIIVLASEERNTGKTTFLNLLKVIFGRNMTFNTNDDFRSQFNADWATKLIVAVDEMLLDRREDSERIKNLSTARSYKAEAKGKDRNEVEFFAKFIFNTNNEHNPIHIGVGENRYWVRRVGRFENGDNPDMLEQMRPEIPAFLWFLLHRTLTTENKSRMWFDHRLLETEALRKMIAFNRGKVECEMIQILQEIIEQKGDKEYRFCISDMAWMLEMRGHKCDHNYIRRVLQQNWKLTPSGSIYYTGERLNYDGSFDRMPRTGRCYTITKEVLSTIV
ncbi:MAG: primase-helicase family protein [Rikenellaceae bacterium]